MGREIESVLRRRGHEVALIIDADSEGEFTREKMQGIDVAIEFTTPATAPANVTRCLEWGIPVVSGTTGWNDSLGEVKLLCEVVGGTFFYASNYSIGMNIFFRVNEYLAGIMNNFPEYGASIRETHHIQKKDAPSGTAITLAEGIIGLLERKSSWVNSGAAAPEVIPIESVREGAVAGIHEVLYDSEVDTIKIEHTSKSRAGLAVGAVMAAEFTQEHKGVLSMYEMMKQIIIESRAEKNRR